MTISSTFKAKMLAGSALALLFGSGVVVGLAWDQTASAGTPDEVETTAASEEREGRRPMIVDNVGLSSVQKTAVDSLVVFHRQRMSHLNVELRRRSRAVIEDLRDDIKQVLNDDQRDMYDVLLAEHDAQRAERRRSKRDK